MLNNVITSCRCYKFPLPFRRIPPNIGTSSTYSTCMLHQLLVNFQTKNISTDTFTQHKMHTREQSRTIQAQRSRPSWDLFPISLWLNLLALVLHFALLVQKPYEKSTAISLLRPIAIAPALTHKPLSLKAFKLNDIKIK